MTTKSAAANGVNESEAKYRALIDDCIREFKGIQKEIRSERTKTRRLRVASQRTLADTWETLRRVEATL
jgi:hypothetical protein